MITFECILEIWQTERVQYMVISFHSGSQYDLPKQDDMQDRDDIVEKAKEAYPNHEILDLTGIVYRGETIWSD